MLINISFTRAGEMRYNSASDQFSRLENPGTGALSPEVHYRFSDIIALRVSRAVGILRDHQVILNAFVWFSRETEG